MKKLMLIIAALALPVAAHAAPCKDAKGKFIKCAPPVTAPTAKPTMAPAKPAMAAAAKPMKVAKAPAAGKKAPCRDAKGRFMKCK